jgi:hypothetical protein
MTRRCCAVVLLLAALVDEARADPQAQGAAAALSGRFVCPWSAICSLRTFADGRRLTW